MSRWRGSSQSPLDAAARRPPRPGAGPSVRHSLEGWSGVVEAVSAVAPGYVKEPGFDEPDNASVVDPDGAGPAIGFLKVPEPKSAKNRMHIDIRVAGPGPCDMAERARLIRAKVPELLAAGATVVREEWSGDDLGHVVTLDPGIRSVTGGCVGDVAGAGGDMGAPAAAPGLVQVVLDHRRGAQRDLVHLMRAGDALVGRVREVGAAPAGAGRVVRDGVVGYLPPGQTRARRARPLTPFPAAAAASWWGLFGGQVVTRWRHRGVPAVPRRCSLQRDAARSNAAIRWSCNAMRSSCVVTRAISEAFIARSSPISVRRSSRDASSSPDTTRLNHDQAAPASTDTQPVTTGMT
jgi:hypothetical protein